MKRKRLKVEVKEETKTESTLRKIGEGADFVQNKVIPVATKLHGLYKMIHGRDMK